MTDPKQSITVKLILKKDTKHTRRYDEQGDLGKLRAIYVPKWILLQTFGKMPDAIRVTIEEA